MIPETVNDIPANVLDPRQSWTDKTAYDTTARDLVSRFAANFEAFLEFVGDDVKAIALKAA